MHLLKKCRVLCEAKEQGATGQSLRNDNALVFSLQDHVVVVAGLEASTMPAPQKIKLKPNNP